MAKKVQKQNIEVKVVDMGGHEFIAKDGEIGKFGQLALQKFMAFEIVEIKTEDDETKTTYIPYHAIDHVEVTRTSEEVEVEDENCVEE